MTVLFSKKCEYALQALHLLAESHEGGTLSAEQIAQRLDIPKEFISKILQSLAKSGFVNSQRGNTGGFKLGRNPEDISLMDIVENIDGTGAFENCVIGKLECNSEEPCSMHDTWAPMRNALNRFMTITSLHDFNHKQSVKGSI